MLSISVQGATCRCTFGTAIIPIQVIPIDGVKICNRPAVKQLDTNLFNISSFGMCSSLSNPLVITLMNTIIIPTVCVPKIVTPPGWNVSKMNIKIGGQYPCSMGDTCMCAYGGIISILNANQSTVF